MDNEHWQHRLQRALVRLFWLGRELLRGLWAILRSAVMAALQLIVALVVLFEEWGWKPLYDLLGWFARFAPIALLERWIAGLPPYGALFVFALPMTVLFPLKLIAMWLLANGKYWTATGLFVAAKLASTAFIARIFVLTKPALMQIRWFARAYGIFVPWKDALFAEIRESFVWRYGRMLKTRMRLWIKQAWMRLRPGVAPLLDRMRAQFFALRTRLGL